MGNKIRNSIHVASASRLKVLLTLALVTASATSLAVVPVNNVPVTLPSVPGNLILVPSFEFPTVATFASDPGNVNAVYVATTAYAGYFNSDLCYGYVYDQVEANRYFFPAARASSGRSCSGVTAIVTGALVQRTWSGNFLNWVSMQAVDTFRLAMTGGYRVGRPADGGPFTISVTGADLAPVRVTTNEKSDATYLEKASSDHYNDLYPTRSMAANSADLQKATASLATTGMKTRISALRNQMWFVPTANLSLGNSLDNIRPNALALPVTDGNQAISDGSNITVIPYNPAVHTLPNSATQGVGSNRVYGNDQVYAVSIRVKVCDGVLDTRDLCTKYGSYYKPEGLLQRNSKALRYSVFGYLNEWGLTRDGGVLRARQKLISPVSEAERLGTAKAYPDKARLARIDNPEWDGSTGRIIANPDTDDAAATNANIGRCASGDPAIGCSVNVSGVINAINLTGQIDSGYGYLKYADNLSELFYAAIRYVRGVANLPRFSSLDLTAPNNAQKTGTTKYQNADGLPVIEDWYLTGANAAVSAWNPPTATNPGPTTVADPMLYECQATVMLGIGDTNTSWEESASSEDAVVTAAAYRNQTEFNFGNQSRGFVSGLAFWAHVNDLRTDVPNRSVSGGAAGAKRGQTAATYWVDVVETGELKNKNSNQYYNATKYGGYSIPDADWNALGNATPQTTAWLDANPISWTTATQNIATASGLGGGGNFFLPSTMYLANNGQKMIDSLSSAFAKITGNLLASSASLAANGSQLDAGSVTYQASYVAGEWKGNVRAFAVASTGTVSTVPSWDAATLLPLGTASANARVIKTCKASCTGDGETIDFTTTSVTASQRTALGIDAAAQDNVINYLRGDDTLELRRSGGTLRNRTSIFGDFINSQPVFVGAPNAMLYANKSFTGSTTYGSFASANNARKRRLYVASNDGMVHGFSAESAAQSGQPPPGKETFAYLPNAVILAGIKNISLAGYGTAAVPHQFYNDGELSVADVYLDGLGGCTGVTCWRTVLVGTTGRGPAKAIYALDVTDPASVKLLWERSAADSNNVGQVIGKPVIAQTANGVWSVLLGNGYNSGGDRPALLKINLLTGAITAYTTPGSAPNDGLAQPAVWNGNATNIISTEAYAGDLSGNVWKFDLSSGTTGTIMYVVKDAAGRTQPISAGMIAGRNPYNKTEAEVWVFFGTGQALQSFVTPSTTDSNQTWYGLIVQGSKAVSAGNDREALKQRTINVEFAATATAVGTRGISKATPNDMVGKKGWYIDLLKPNPNQNTTLAQGERMLTPNQFQGPLLLGTSRLPSPTSSPCDPAGFGWIMAIEPFTGVPPKTNFFDVNGDGSFTRADNAGGTDYNTSGIGYGSLINNGIFIGNYLEVNGEDGGIKRMGTSGVTGNAARVSWRELVVQ